MLTGKSLCENGIKKYLHYCIQYANITIKVTVRDEGRRNAMKETLVTESDRNAVSPTESTAGGK